MTTQTNTAAAIVLDTETLKSQLQSTEFASEVAATVTTASRDAIARALVDCVDAPVAFARVISIAPKGSSAWFAACNLGALEAMAEKIAHAKDRFGLTARQAARVARRLRDTAEEGRAMLTEAIRQSDAPAYVVEIDTDAEGKSEITIAADTGRGYRKRFGIGAVRRGDSGRKVFQGPLVPGPWAFSFGLCSVIDNNGGTARERADKLTARTEFDVEDGDLLSIDGDTYRVQVKRVAFDVEVKLIAA